MRQVNNSNIFICGIKEVTEENLKKYNIKAILTVCDKTIPIFDSSIWQIQVKMDDPQTGLAPNNPIKLAVSIFEKARSRAEKYGGNILVHCVHGNNRSALTVALALEKEGISLKEAVKLTQVKDNKPWMKDLGYIWEE